MIKKYFALSLIASSLVVAGCSSDDDPAPVVDPGPPVATPGEGGTAYDFIVNNGSVDAGGEYSTLLQAIDTAGLADTLDDPATPFTIFAPTNDAFTAFLTDAGLTAEELLASPDLASILTYHAVAGSVDAAAATAAIGTDVTTVNGAALPVTAGGPLGVVVGGVDVTGVDLGEGAVTIGVVHSLGGVLTVPADPVDPVDPGDRPPVMGAADQALFDLGGFDIVRAAVNQFFPEQLDTNAWTAFIPSDTVLGDAGVTALTSAQLQDHIVSSEAIDPTTLAGRTSVTSSSNLTYTVAVDAGVTTVNGSEVTFLTSGAGGAQIYSIAGVLAAAQ